MLLINDPFQATTQYTNAMNHPLLDELNQAQSDAVSAPETNLLVLAGAGSGKTRVLVHRVAWLMQMHDISPFSIMAVTFTNKAAREMQGRLETLTQRSARSMWVGTFHGLCHRFLRTHWAEANLAQHFQVLDSDDQNKIVKRIIAELNLDDKKFPVRQAVGFINNQKDEGFEQLMSKPVAIIITIDWWIFMRSTRSNAKPKIVDFGELLLRAHETLRDNTELLAHYRQRFRHILVDEFQDTNAVQYAWLRLLAGEKTSWRWAMTTSRFIAGAEQRLKIFEPLKMICAGCNCPTHSELPLNREHSERSQCGHCQ